MTDVHVFEEVVASFSERLSINKWAKQKLDLEKCNLMELIDMKQKNGKLKLKR